jgi:hypothetical protein
LYKKKRRAFTNPDAAVWIDARVVRNWYFQAEKVGINTKNEVLNNEMDALKMRRSVGLMRHGIVITVIDALPWLIVL